MASQITTFKGRRGTKVPRANNTTSTSTSSLSSSSSSSSTSISSTTGTPDPQPASSTPSTTFSASLSSISPSSSSASPFQSKSATTMSSTDEVKTEKPKARPSPSSSSAIPVAPVPTLLGRPPPVPPPPPLDGSLTLSSSGPENSAAGSQVTIDSVPFSATTSTQEDQSEPVISASIGSTATTDVAPPGPPSTTLVSATLITVITPTPTTSSSVATTAPALLPSPKPSSTSNILDTEAQASASHSTESTALSASVTPSSDATQPAIFVPIPSSSDAQSSTNTIPTLSNLSQPPKLSRPTASINSFSAAAGPATLTSTDGTPRLSTSTTPIANLSPAASGPYDPNDNGSHRTDHDPSEDHSNSTSHGKVVAIAAGTVSGVLGLALLVALVMFCLRGRRRRRGVESSSPARVEKRPPSMVRSFRRARLGNGLKALISRPMAMASGVKERFHSRGTSSDGFVTSPPQMPTTGAEDAYRPRRSQSEPLSGFAGLPRVGRPSLEQYTISSPAIGRQQPLYQLPVSESPGPIQCQQYQMPWTESPNATPIPKTLRVVNSASNDNTPMPLPSTMELAGANDSYFGIQTPPRAAAAVSVPSHRRSMSLQLIGLDDPFLDGIPAATRLSNNQASEEPFRPSAKHVRNFSHVLSYNTRPMNAPSQHCRHAPAEFDTGLRGASLAPAEPIAATEASSERIQRPSDLFTQYTASVATQGTMASRKPSADGTGDMSTIASLPGFGSSNEGSPGISPTTDATTVSRNISDASRSTSGFWDTGRTINGTALLKHVSYDPFNYNGSQRTSQPAAPLVTPSRPARSDSTSLTDKRGTCFPDTTSLSAFDEPSPSRLSTQNAGSSLTPGSQPSRTLRAISNDPFDLDRPEVLGYTPGAMKTRFDYVCRADTLKREDSSASKGSVAGRRSRRRSSLQNGAMLSI